MSQPAYTWWPWRFLALSAPILALGGAALAASEHRPRAEVLAVFFSVLAAANGYLFAMAVGDFGRSITAIPIGAAAGYAAVFLFSYPLPNAIFITILLVIAGLSMGARLMKMLSGCVIIVFLSIALLSFIGVAVNRHATAEPEIAIICSYPFVCGCVASSMPIENSLRAVIDAWLAGIRASLHGMAMGGLASIGLGVLVAILMSSVRSRSVEQAVAVGFLVITLALANYFCVQNIFTAVHRAEGVRETAVIEHDNTRPSA